MTEREADDELKKISMSPPALALPNSTGQFTVDPDASVNQYVCVLRQEQEDKQLKPSGYWLWSFWSTECSNDTTHKECLAKVRSIFMVCTFLEETPL